MSPRAIFLACATVILLIEVLFALLWPVGLLSLVVAAPLVGLGLYDMAQTRHTIRRNFPLLGHGRYLMEKVRPEIQQYFIESRLEAYPIEREFRSVVYQRAKRELETNPFGSHRNMYAAGYEYTEHSVAPAEPLAEAPRVMVGRGQCEKPYALSLLNISAMSFGALSPNAILALSKGARMGGFAHNTGEGGVSKYHLEGGGDLIWQIGTGYFGCRDADGRFDRARYADQAAHDAVKMVELKLSQGAKPGHGGVLPGVKVTPEIAAARGVPEGQTVLSPPWHTAFGTPTQLLEFMAELRDRSGGKPVGMKICIGRQDEFLAICKAMVRTGLRPDFVTVDGGEGGTGAAPLEFSNSVGMPGHDAWIFVHNALVGVGLRDSIRVIASGKILTGFHVLRALALGADACNSARGMMFALGCIQALRCNTNACPTGVATMDPALTRGLVVADKAQRVANYHQQTLHGFLELLAAIGLGDPADLTPGHINRRVGDTLIRNYDDLYPWLEKGTLLTIDGQPANGSPDDPARTGTLPESYQRAWQRADPDSWASSRAAARSNGKHP